MRIELTRPVSYKDTEISALELELDGLTGNDLITAESNYRKADPDGQLFSSLHMLYIAARACHIPAETLRMMGARDYMTVIARVLDFFGSMNSEISRPEVTDD